MSMMFNSKLFSTLVVFLTIAAPFKAQAQSADFELFSFFNSNKSFFDFKKEDIQISVPARSFDECSLKCEETFDGLESSTPLELITFDKKAFSFDRLTTSDASNLEQDPFCLCSASKFEIDVPKLPEHDPELIVLYSSLFKCDYTDNVLEDKGGDWMFHAESSEIGDNAMALYTPLSLGTDVKAGLGVSATSNALGLTGIVGVGFEIRTPLGPMSFVCGLLFEPGELIPGLDSSLLH